MNATPPIRVLVVDDHTLFRRGLIALLGDGARFVVVGEAGDAGEAQRRAAELRPDVILLDNHLPGVRGVDALGGLKEVAPQARVLMLTVSEDEQDLADALRGGARGYLLKTVDGEVLASAIERAMRGESTVSPEMTGKLVTAFQSLHGQPVQPAPEPDRDPIHSLSPREHEILSHIARGASNKEIARALDIAETTVKIHVQHILRKLNLASRVQAAVYAAGRMPP
jgi:two-component system nitrate/nitrite response regulator NarL